MREKGGGAERSSKRIVALLLLLAVLIGVAVIRFWPSRTDPSPFDATARATTKDQQTEFGRETPPDQPPAAVDGGSDSSSSARDIGDETAIEEAPSPQRIVIHFKDGDGKAVPQWAFRYALKDYRSAIAEMREGHEALMARSIRTTNDGITGSDGIFEILEDRDFSGFKIYAIRFGNATSGYSFKGPGGYPGELGPGEYGLTVPEKGGTFTITLLATRRISFSIQYADGAPYEGQVGVQLPTPGDRGRALQLAAGEFGEFDLPGHEGDCTIGCLSKRVGYKASNSWHFDSLQMPSVVELTIPEDPKQCLVTVNLRDWPAGERVSVFLYTRNDATVVTEEAEGGQLWKTTRVHGDGVWYGIEVNGPSGLWRSPQFKMKYSEEREFVALPSKPFSVRARFLDAEGRPLRGAAIDSTLKSYPNWHVLRYQKFDDMLTWRKGFLVFSGADGVAELTHLPAGEVALVLEARECEAIHKTVTGEPGQQVDLGDVTFEPGKCRIELRLLNIRPDVGYMVWVMGPTGAGDVRVVSDIRKNTVVIDRLARRPYQLYVCAGDGGDGGPVPNPIVDFENSDVATLSVDAAGWLTMDERRRK